jgi:hypothetical protein
MNIFIGSISFEDRCSTAIEKSALRFEIGYVSCAIEVGDYKDLHITKFHQKIDDLRHISTSYAESLTNLRAFQDVAEELRALDLDGNDLNIYWDITTFRRENIALLMLSLHLQNVKAQLHLLYTDATDYSVNEAPKQKWLSRGVSKVGNILGYNGVFAAEKNLCLVIFLGIETERIRALIEKTAPSHVIFLLPETKHVNLDEVRNEVYNSVRPECSFELRRMQIDNPVKISNELLDIVSERDYNYGICSFNSKRTVVGFCLAALQRRELRLFYIWAEAYNKKGYSLGGSDISDTVISLPFDFPQRGEWRKTA